MRFGGLVWLAAIGAALLAGLLPSRAQAAWMEASSAHFVIYADDSEAGIRRFAEQLERYHDAMSVVTGFRLERPSPSNRLIVYVVRDDREVRRLFGEGGHQVAGFYIPRAGGSIAVVPRLRQGRGETDRSMTILLHEYAHHFLISNSGFPVPAWVSEGSAEFFAAAEFGRDGSLSVGRPASHRWGELLYASDVKAEQLLDPDTFARLMRNRFNSFYGKSWLLYHYLTFNEARAGQMKRYLDHLIAGRSSLDAAREAFGSLSQLESELDAYMRQRRMLTIKFEPGQLETGSIVVRQLRAGEAAILPVVTRSRRGVTREQAVAVVQDARQIAAQYPDDPAVLAALAEAEHDAGNDAEAIAAADAAIALDAGNVNAHVQKGYALFRRAQEAEDRPVAFDAAIAPFLALNQIENDHPLPLIYYHRSFVDSGRQVPQVAVQGLERAAELAPFDLSLRLNLAFQQVSEGRLDAARYNLIPIAYNPHGGDMASSARAAVDRIASGESLDMATFSALMRPSAEESVVTGDE